MSNKELSRHQIREMAVQALFPLIFNQDLSKQAAINHALTLNLFDQLDEEHEHFVPAYLDLLVSGVCEYQSSLDQLIESHLRSGWKISRLSKMDVTILRLALFEMLYVEDVPNAVALNEAIELAKTFSDEKSRRFVNGVLSAINQELKEKSE
ncbi:MAG TPA: transcription antitermination factor NusB [Enterococcus columbae]|nr:transcription antitermination factor NusB [Enterococcus columbae]